MGFLNPLLNMFLTFQREILLRKVSCHQLCMPVLRKGEERTEALRCLLVTAGANCLATSLTEALISVQAGLLPHFSTLCDGGNIFEHVQAHIGCAMSGGGVLVRDSQDMTVGLLLHLVSIRQGWHPDK